MIFYQVFSENEFKVLSDEVLENNHKRLRVQARDRLREYPRIQMLGHLFECESQLEEHINQEYDAFKKKIKKKLKRIKAHKKNIAIIKGAAVLTSVLTLGAVVVKHTK